MSLQATFKRVGATCARLASLAVLATAAGGAAAAVVGGSFAFNASGFPPGAPAGAVLGTVSFSFDNAATFIGAADGAVRNGAPVQVSVTGLSLPGGWTPVLTYIQSGTVGGFAVTDLVAVGHALAGTVVNPGTDDWRVAFNAASSQPSFREFTYASAGLPGELFVSTTGQVSPVPEPAAWALLCAGALALVWRRPGRRWQSRAATPAAAPGRSE